MPCRCLDNSHVTNYYAIDVFNYIYNGYRCQPGVEESSLLSMRVLSKPNRPVARWEGHCVSVKWEWPENDDDIIGYIVKYGNEDRYDTMEVNSNSNLVWVPCARLQDGTSYRFAVAAKYRDGRQGEFSEYSNDVSTSLGKRSCECD